MRNGKEIFCLGRMRIWHIKVIYDEAISAIGEIENRHVDADRAHSMT
jgi:hypothetical protein